MLKRWKTLKSKKVFECPWYYLTEDKFELPNQKQGKYYVVQTHNSVLVIPLNIDRKILLIRQYRYPVNDFYYELPAGGIEKGDSVLTTAKKELEEETGFRAKNFKKIGIYAPMNGLCKEISTVYIASDLEKRKQKLESTEFIEVKAFSIKKVYKMIDENKIQDGMTLAALAIARKYLLK